MTLLCTNCNLDHNISSKYVIIRRMFVYIWKKSRAHNEKKNEGGKGRDTTTHLIKTHVFTHASRVILNLSCMKFVQTVQMGVASSPGLWTKLKRELFGIAETPTTNQNDISKRTLWARRPIAVHVTVANVAAMFFVNGTHPGAIHLLAVWNKTISL